jgi:heterodisulfide reductase subunit B
MKVYKQNDVFYMEDNNQTVALTPNKDYYLKLPTNSCNRVWVSCKKVDDAPNQSLDYGTEVKVARLLGPRSEQSKKLLDYATDEERKTIEAILAKCRERKEKDKPAPKTELEKAKALAEKYAARVKELKAQQKENK